MKVLVVGGGGREHALAWKIAGSPAVKKVYCAPGNAGTAALGENVPIDAGDIVALRRFAFSKKVDLTVVGPEAPLTEGIVNVFEEHGLRVFGPARRAAELEGSKVFSKNFMRKHGIPTADFRTFHDMEAAKSYLDHVSYPQVVKADGLAAGKGVIVCANEEEAVEAVHQIMGRKKFGAAGAQVVIEECLVGEEASIIAFTDGRTILTMPSSQDHKRVGEGDTGPNTGGMGAYSPAPIVDADLQRRVEKDVLVPAIHAARKEGRPYRGALYAGIMVTEAGPKALEFNVRFGDPETQPLLMRMKSDLVEVLEACIDGTLDRVEAEWDPRPSVCVVMASGGYPEAYEKGKPITGLDKAGALSDTYVFHAGTALDPANRVVTAGGRVLGVTALGDGLREALDRVYEAADCIAFEGAQFRRDIAYRAL
jgi:phosphoribosylamine--glycine ligase